MTTIDVAVTTEHITAGQRKEPYLCPVALGVKDALLWAGEPLSTFVTVADRIGIRRDGDAPLIVVPTPRLVYARIRRYDRGMRMRPFTFTLELPDGPRAATPATPAGAAP